jgi:protein-disulfide isomerase
MRIFAKLKIIRLLSFWAAVLIQLSAQSKGTKTTDANIQRRIELVLRSQMNIPSGWKIQLRSRKGSTIPGFDNIEVAFAADGSEASQQAVSFLISKDNATLARLSQYSLNDIASMHIDISGRPVYGNASSRVKVIVFGDYECPYCAHLHADLIDSTISHYKDNVSVVYSDFPLSEIHPWAMRAAEIANCLAAADSSQYWKYVNYVYSHQDVIGKTNDLEKSFVLLDDYARKAVDENVVNVERYQKCMDVHDDSAINLSMKVAKSLNVEATPTIFVNGEQLSGYARKEDLWNAIDRAIQSTNK